jgi:DNA-directed RNA polymerase subunit H
MHILQPKHTKLKQEEINKLVSDLNISLTQLPKIKITDPSLPENTEVGDVFKIERKTPEGISVYYRVVTV